MSLTNTRIARTAAGAACIIAIIAAFGWFTFQFVPGTPRSPEPDTITGRSQASASSRFDAVHIVDVSPGQTITLEEVTQGKGFSYSEETIASWSEEKREQYESFDTWRYDLPVLDITVTGFNSMSEEAFIEWYPHYGDARLVLSNAEKRVFLADLTITNPGDESALLPSFILWSESFIGSNNKLENGVHPDGGLTAELCGEPREGSVAYGLPDEWNSIAAGETCTFTVPFLVYKNAFINPAAYENIDPSKFCLALADYDPPTIYRFWLG